MDSPGAACAWSPGNLFSVVIYTFIGVAAGFQSRLVFTCLASVAEFLLIAGRTDAASALITVIIRGQSVGTFAYGSGFGFHIQHHAPSSFHCACSRRLFIFPYIIFL